jgi:hypothetical protein
MPRTHQINGHVVGVQSDGWLRIEAVPIGTRSGATIADAIVGPDGRFSLVVAEERLPVERTSGRRGVYFRVLREGELLVDTRTHIHWFVGDKRHVHIHGHHHHRVAAGGSAGSGGAPAAARPVIAGTVLHANGGPVPAVSVRAFDKTLRHEVQIGTATTAANGTYAIDYDATTLAHRAGHPPDLVVRVVRSDGTLWGESPVLFRAPSPATIDVVVDGANYVGFSEFERVSQAIEPELDGVPPKNLSAADVSFLAKDCALPAPAVQAFADSARLADVLGVPQGEHHQEG